MRQEVSGRRKNDEGCVVVVVDPDSAPVPMAMFARNCATWNG